MSYYRCGRKMSWLFKYRAVVCTERLRKSTESSSQNGRVSGQRFKPETSRSRNANDASTSFSSLRCRRLSVGLCLAYRPLLRARSAAVAPGYSTRVPFGHSFDVTDCRGTFLPWPSVSWTWTLLWEQTCSLNKTFHQEARAVLAPRRGTLPGADGCLFWTVSNKLIDVSLSRVVEF
jgi:hypothetical protein